MNTSDASGSRRAYPISWVVGGKRMQDTVTVFPDGRWQILPVYFHVTGNGQWVDYNEKKQGVVTPSHPFFWTNFRRTANHECLYCHVTALDAGYDRQTRTWRTAFADPGVACEACHGPGEVHARTKRKSDIVRASKLDDERKLAICGQCHGPREPIFPLLDTRDGFHPGDRYEERLRPLMIVDGTSRSGEFFADGRPSSSSFEYQAIIQSRCFMEGRVTCLTCHTAPHEEHGVNEIEIPAGKTTMQQGDETCRECHATLFQSIEAHTHHRSPAAQSCVACHMPPVVTGVLDHFADHSLDVPNPGNTTRHGVPNACGVCHADRKPEELSTEMTAWWPDIGNRWARRSRLADAFDEKTASGSRAALLAVVSDVKEAPALRGAAALLIGQRFPADARETLVPLLASSHGDLRARLIEGLGFARARGAADAIAPYLSGEESIPVRQDAAMVLDLLGDPRGRAALAALANDPRTSSLVRPHTLLGLDALRRNDLGVAEEELDRSLDLVPYNPEVLVGMADISMAHRDMARAEAFLSDALHFDPAFQPALDRLAFLKSVAKGGTTGTIAP